MVGTQLVDLDELVLLCRDEQAKKYISEAVACYKSGAFRACIVTTWTAVVFDFINKLQQLELTGDANARRRLDDFEKIRQQRDLKGSLRFEKQVLTLAKDEFELISPLEYDDLARLLEDRNRCAHPSMNSQDEMYQPTAELARYHLRNAVTHLLQHPPVQGKAALRRLVDQVNSPYFPDDWEEAATFFTSGPLAKPRDALVRNFVIVLLKDFLSGELDRQAERRHIAALNAVLNMHREVVENTFAEKLNIMMGEVSDEEINLLLNLLHDVPGACEFIQSDTRARLEGYLFSESLSPRFFASAVYWALGIGFLREKGVKRLDDYLELFEKSHSRARATEVGLSLPFLIPFLELEQIERVIKAISDNDHIKSTRLAPILLEVIRKRGRVTLEEFTELLVRYGLDRTFPSLLTEEAE